MGDLMSTTPAIEFDLTLNLARQSLYRFAALTLLDPKDGAWERLAALRDDSLLADAAALIRELPSATATQLSLGERPLSALDPQAVLRQLPNSRQALNDQFEAAFGLLVSNACPPYETEYISSKFTFQRSNALADVGGFYHAFGLQIADEHPERPDHIVLELEFMASLLALERRAEGNAERGAICRDAQRRFLDEHLAWWAPAFARLLGREARGGFYEAAGVFLSALVPAERALIGVLPSSQAAASSPIEEPEACEGCQLTSLAN
jgi:TorA maturation chaperone TorD